MTKKCKICGKNVEELYETPKGNIACWDCFRDEVMADFDEDDESDIETAEWKVVKPKKTQP